MALEFVSKYLNLPYLQLFTHKLQNNLTLNKAFQAKFTSNLKSYNPKISNSII